MPPSSAGTPARNEGRFRDLARIRRRPLVVEIEASETSRPRRVQDRWEGKGSARQRGTVWGCALDGLDHAETGRSTGRQPGVR